MINSLVGLVLFIPLLTLTLHLIINDKKVHNTIHISFSILQLILAVIVLFTVINHPININFGGWQAPFGINFNLNRLNVLLICIFLFMALTISLYSLNDPDLNHFEKSFHCSFWLLIFGAINLVSTRDIFNFYVWSELILVSCFILINSSQRRNIVALSHYAVINIIGTLVMLLGIALIYAIVGSLYYPDITLAVSKGNAYLYSAILLFLVAIFIKAAIFPFYFWLPKAYPHTSNTSTLLLSSLVTKAMIFSVMVFFVCWHLYKVHYIVNAAILLSWFTMFLGVIGAACQFDMKKILSFHIISQLGYILLAITIPSKLAIIAMFYFLIHNIIVKSGLLMSSGLIERKYGLTKLSSLNCIRDQSPLFSCVFLFFAFSLAGFPPLSGFWAKFLLLKAAILEHYYFSATVAIFVSMFTLYSMLKIWHLGFSESEIPDKIPANSISRVNYFPLFLLLFAMIMLSLAPSFIIRVIK